VSDLGDLDGYDLEFVRFRVHGGPRVLDGTEFFAMIGAGRQSGRDSISLSAKAMLGQFGEETTTAAII
jgi:hypothetical protein